MAAYSITHLATKNGNDTNATGSITATGGGLLVACVVAGGGDDTDGTFGGTCTATWVKLARVYGGGVSLGFWVSDDYLTTGTVQYTNVGGGVSNTCIFIAEALGTVGGLGLKPAAQQPLQTKSQVTNDASPASVTFDTTPVGPVIYAANGGDQPYVAAAGVTVLDEDHAWFSAAYAAGTAVPGPVTPSMTFAGSNTLPELAVELGVLPPTAGGASMLL